MKKLMLFVSIAFLVISCSNQGEKTETEPAAANVGTKYDYAYTLDEPYKNWQPGDQQHVVTVLKSLKAWETGDMDACILAFGDSIDIRFDGFHQKFSKDSLKTFFTNYRNGLSSVNIKMSDWESVISSDKKEQWVTLWYKEITTDKAGKTDSLAIVDDAKIVDGKIVVLDQKIQHYPSKK